MSERLPLHVLPTFVIAARLENLRATAQQVHLTHGAVSQQIQLLEQAVGYSLFERRAAASQTLRISVLPSFAHYWLLPRLPAFHEACADIALDIDASLTLQDLSQRGFDAAIRIGNGQWAGLQAQRIASGDVLPVASPDMARQWGTAFENGGDVPLLEHDVSPWRDWFNAQGRSLCGRQQALFNDAGLLIRAAEQGFGIALAKKLLVQDAIAAGRLVALAAPCRLSDDDVYLVWPQTAGLTPAVLRLLQWLQQQLAAI